jgi:hypothetical protein
LDLCRDIDNVADTMDGIDDTVAMVEDLDTALSQPLGNALADVSLLKDRFCSC